MLAFEARQACNRQSWAPSIGFDCCSCNERGAPMDVLSTKRDLK